MKTTDALKEKNLHRCGHCGRVLSLDCFYVNSRTGRPDGYCKECRKETNRCARKMNRLAAGGGGRVNILLVEDPQLRLRLILLALRHVRERYFRKREREKEEEERGG